jgi:hypothetical protein
MVQADRRFEGSGWWLPSTSSIASLQCGLMLRETVWGPHSFTSSIASLQQHSRPWRGGRPRGAGRWPPFCTGLMLRLVIEAGHIVLYSAPKLLSTRTHKRYDYSSSRRKAQYHWTTFNNLASAVIWDRSKKLITVD